MNKKIFKRLLIATSMLSPVVMMTPMILTSCNDDASKKPSTPSDSEKEVKLGTITDLFKVRTKKDSPNILFDDVDNHFWLDSIDLRNGELTIESQVKRLLEELIVDKQKVIKSLKETQKFSVEKSDDDTSYSPIETIGQTDYLANYLLFKKESDKYGSTKEDIDNLNTVFQNVYLSNQIFNNSQDSNSIIINGSKLNFSELLSKVEVRSRIKIIDTKQKTTNDSINDVFKTNNFVIQYSFKPKSGYYWSGITNSNHKDLPLIITIRDNVDEIELIKDIDKFNKDASNPQKDEIPFVGSDKKVTVASGETFDLVYVGKQLGVDNLQEIASGSGTTQPITSDKANTIFSFLNDVTLTGKIGEPGSEETATISWDNFNNALSKDRIKVEIVEATKNPASGDTTDVTIKLKISLINSISNKSTPDYEWLTSTTTQNKNVLPILIALKVVKQQ